MGNSGRAFLKTLSYGQMDPEEPADLRNVRLRSSRRQLVESLRGKVTVPHRVHLKLYLNHIQAIEDAIATIDAKLQNLLAPFADAVERLKTIPCVRQTAAQVLIAESGNDMSRFPSVGHLISWAGLCPRNDESAAKRRSTKTGKAHFGSRTRWSNWRMVSVLSRLVVVTCVQYKQRANQPCASLLFVRSSFLWKSSPREFQRSAGFRQTSWHSAAGSAWSRSQPGGGDCRRAHSRQLVGTPERPIDLQRNTSRL